MRITFAVTMVLFLAPTVYVVKYYAVDRPREEAIADRIVFPEFEGPNREPDELLREARRARDGQLPLTARQWAIRDMGDTLRTPSVNYKRPIECLMAKATLADLATKDPNPAVRAEASTELGKVAQGGAVIRR